MKKQYTLKLLPQQIQIMKSKKAELLFSGGFGSGKSCTLALKCLQGAQIPGNTVLLCRKTLTSLKNSTLTVLLNEKIGGHYILPPGAYDYNIQANRINLHGGGIIRLLGIEDQAKTRVRSINAGLVCIDEAIELTQSEYTELFMRLRNH